MNLAEIVSVFGIFVAMWWVGRKVAQAFDRYELMERQRKTKEYAGRDTSDRRQSTEKVRVAVQPRARASGSR